MTYADTQIDHVAGLLECFLASGSVEYDETLHRFMHWTPLVPIGRVEVEPGAARALSVSGTTAVVTVVPGTTKFSDVLGDWTASPAASALAVLGGDAGTIPIGFSGETVNLGLRIQAVVRCPPAFLPSAERFPALAVYRRGTPAIEGPPVQRRHSSDVVINYSIGDVPRDKVEEYWGYLQGIVVLLDEALQRRKHPNYPHSGSDRGKPLEQIAGIHSIELISAPTFSAEFPDGPVDGAINVGVECSASMVHAARFEPSNLAALDKLALSYREANPRGATDPGVTVETLYDEP